jgi:hypothetical protein
VTKGQAVPVVDEEIRLEKLGDRIKEFANGQRCHCGEVVEREAATKTRCKGRDPRRDG